MIYVVNKCPNLVDHPTAQKWVAAWQRQVVGDFAPVWKQSADVHYAGDGTGADAPGKDDRILNLVTYSSSEGALGSHWLNGLQAIGEVGVQTCLDEGIEPSACGSHELLEMLLDPYASLSFQVGKLMLSAEVCDRVEDSNRLYKIDGVALENFSYPSAFLDGAPGPWDFCHICSSNNVLSGGYQLQVDISTNQWTQVTGMRVRKSKTTAGPMSRRAGRMLRAGVDPSQLVVAAAT